jgi:hypothetical protein
LYERPKQRERDHDPELQHTFNEKTSVLAFWAEPSFSANPNLPLTFICMIREYIGSQIIRAAQLAVAHFGIEEGADALRRLNHPSRPDRETRSATGAQ